MRKVKAQYTDIIHDLSQKWAKSRLENRQSRTKTSNSRGYMFVEFAGENCLEIMTTFFQEQSNMASTTRLWLCNCFWCMQLEKSMAFKINFC